jgi:hypothetical protein
MSKEFWKFLLLGPLLFNITKVIYEIRSNQMGLRETLQAFNDRMDTVISGQATITGEFRDDFQRLNDKLANVPVPEDVSDVLASMDGNIGKLESGVSELQGLDQPNPSEAVWEPGTISTPEPVPDETTVASPGEPFSFDDDGNIVKDEPTPNE